MWADETVFPSAHLQSNMCRLKTLLRDLKNDLTGQTKPKGSRNPMILRVPPQFSSPPVRLVSYRLRQRTIEDGRQGLTIG